MDESTTKRYQVPSPPVISETVDGEAVVINLDTGNYFSLRGAASLLWPGFVAGQSPGDASATLHRRFDAPPGVIESAVAGFVEALLADGLIVPLNGSREAPAAIEPDSSADAEGRVPFDGCVHERFEDMQSLLLLDPIHEVDDQGWPRAGC